MAENRRTRITKRMIHDAFLELLEEHPMSKITVTEICEKADVNRSTFYANYIDTEQLLCEIENEVLSRVPISPELPSANYEKKFIDILENYFKFVRQNERLFRVLIIQADNRNFNEKLLETVMKTYYQKTWTTDSLLSKYYYIYCVNGVIGLMKEWINSRFETSERKLAEIVLQMCVQASKIQNIKL